MSDAKGGFPYMDDFIIGGVDNQNHRENLVDVLGRIQSYGFHLKLDKCEFGKKEIEFLSHIVSVGGIRRRPDPREVLRSYPPPKDLQRLQAFLGVIWYGKFIAHFKDMRGPLDELMQKDVKFK